VVFCLDFDPFIFLFLFPCQVFFLYLLIYLFILDAFSITSSLIGVKGHSGTSSICTCVQAEELKELLMDEKLMKNLTWLKILFHFPTDCCQSHLFKVCSNVGQF
jgi:hypothetical protein